MSSYRGLSRTYNDARSTLSVYDPLHNTRNDLVRDHAAVLAPVLLILVLASSIVSPGSVEQQEAQVERIEVWQGMGEQSRDAPEKGSHDLRNVVEVSVASRSSEILEN
jgi:hypothetical protein